MDFNPNLNGEDNSYVKKPTVEVNDTPAVYEPTSIVVESNRQNKELISMGGLLGLTKAHLEDDMKCKQDIERLTKAIDDVQHLLSPKELIEYLKVKLHEREFHTECIFKAYAIIQKTDMAKEMMAGSERRERIIEATDRTKINYLLGKLNPKRREEMD
jgi:hypothetical protein